MALAGDYADVFLRWDHVRNENISRDHRHALVAKARRGDVRELMPDMFPDMFDKQLTANMINLAAQSIGEMVGSLPDINCKPDRFTSAVAKKAADLRTKIANGHAEYSRLATQLPTGGDRMTTYGFLPFVVEPDFEKMIPTIRVGNPVGSYYRMDHFGRVREFYERWFDTAGRLAARFPEHEAQIYGRHQTVFGEQRRRSDDSTLEVVKYYGAEGTLLFLGEERCALAWAPNPMGRVPVFVAQRPQWDDEVRGQYDEMLWVQLARAFMTTLSMEAAHKAVNAPLAVPNDVGQIAFGSDAIVRSANPQGIQRVPLEIPSAAFQENALLAGEERLAARFPEAASGNIDASIITGQGVQALLSTMDTQVRTLQMMIATALSDALTFCMEMDETLFGDVEKYIKGKIDGSPYSLQYVPSKAINGDYDVECTYGFATGLDANRALVFMLQALAAGLIDKDSVIRKLPLDVDPTEIAERIDIEQLQDALKQGVFGLAASFPQMAQMGMDPMDSIMRVARAIEARQKGKPMHEAIIKAFEPTKEEKAAAEAAAAQQAQDPLAALMGGGGGDAPVDPQLAQGAGSRPDVQQLLAGLTQGGDPMLQAGVSRMQAAN